MTDSEIRTFLSNFFDEKRLVRDDGNFENILNDKTVCRWGYDEPLIYMGHRIAFLQCSPSYKGCSGNVFYDFVSEENYQKIKDRKFKELYLF